ncbi:MAG: hypothetical protein J6S67_17655 [Methanobrevibacter sp.]|nr:hypothetical protein [Methanobrevibacter sp.]
MIKLEKEIRRKGVDLSQIYRDDKLAIYVARQKHVDDDGFSEWFEVFKITVLDGDRFRDEEFELYPSDSAFGNWAWSCADCGTVAKVIYKNFSGHKLNKAFEKYIDGYYSSGERWIPYFKMDAKELLECLYSIRE